MRIVANDQAEFDAKNAEIDALMRPLMARYLDLGEEVAWMERQSDMFGRHWRVELPPDHPQKAELVRLRAEIDDLHLRRPNHPFVKEMKDEFLEAVCGNPSDRIADLINTAIESI